VLSEALVGLQVFAEFEFNTRNGSDGCDICWQSVPDVHNSLGREMKTNFKGRSVGSQLILMPAGVRAALLQLSLQTQCTLP
jgi:hypothetical protein